MQTSTCRLNVGYGVLFLDDDASKPVTDPDQELDLIAAQGPAVRISTGIAAGWVQVQIEVLASEPAVEHSTRAGFEESAELSIPRGQSNHFILHATSGLPPDDVDIRKPEGPWIRIRVDASGRQISWDMAVEESQERYLITLWAEGVFRPPVGQMPAEPPPNPEIEQAIREAIAELEAKGPVDHSAPQQVRRN